MKVKFSTEESTFNVFKSPEDIKNHLHALIGGGSTLPSTFSRRSNIIVEYNPTTSKTKEAEFKLVFGAGLRSKQQQNSNQQQQQNNQQHQNNKQKQQQQNSQQQQQNNQQQQQKNQ